MHVPAESTHVSVVHPRLSLQLTAVPSVHVPDELHVSSPLQPNPSVHDVPPALFVQSVVLVPVLHNWQMFPGLSAPFE